MTDTHFFRPYVDEGTVTNPALGEAFDLYEKALASFEFANFDDREGKQGVGLDEVRTYFSDILDTDPLHSAYDNSEESLSYIIESEDYVPQSTETKYSAALNFHFVNRRLFFAEVRMLTDSAEGRNYASYADIQALYEQGAPLAAYADLAPQTFGFGQIMIADRPIYNLFLPLEADGEEFASFTIFDEGHAEDFFVRTLKQEFESNENSILRHLVRYDTHLRRQLDDEEVQSRAMDIPHALDDMYNPNILENKAMRSAFNSMKVLLEEVTLADTNTTQGHGSSSQEMIQALKDQPGESEAQITKVKASETEEYVFSLFRSDDIHPTNKTPRQAELKGYFLEDELTYVDVFGLDTFFYLNELPVYREMVEVHKPGSSLADLLDEEPIIMGFGQFVSEGDTYYELLVPEQGEGQEELLIVVYIFKGDRLQQAYFSPYEKVKDKLRNALVETYWQYTGL